MPTEYLRIRNWDKWQSYRQDRGQPPWIKVHRAIMRDPEWVALNDAQRGQLVALWLLAADRNGVIPASPQVIQKLCFMDCEPDLQLFINHGFIDAGATMTPERRQVDVNMTNQSREEKSREEKKEKKSKPKEKISTKRSRPPFQPPSLQDCQSYATDKGLALDIDAFHDYFQSNGWRVGKNPMKDWKAALRGWARREHQFSKTTNTPSAAGRFMDNLKNA